MRLGGTAILADTTRFSDYCTADYCTADRFDTGRAYSSPDIVISISGVMRRRTWQSGADAGGKVCDYVQSLTFATGLARLGP
jgi:hypothetical protein